MNQTRYKRYREMAFYGPLWVIIYAIDKIAETGNWWAFLLVALALLWLTEAGAMAYQDRLGRKRTEEMA